MPANGLAQGDLVEPVDRAEAADVAVAYRLQHPEVEIVSLMVAGSVREVAVVTLGGSLDGVCLDQLVRFGHYRKAPHRLHILSFALTYQQRALGIFLQVVGVLGNAAYEDQRVAVSVQAVRHHRAERVAGHRLGMRREHAAVFLEQQFPGWADGVGTHWVRLLVANGMGDKISIITPGANGAAVRPGGLPGHAKARGIARLLQIAFTRAADDVTLRLEVERSPFGNLVAQPHLGIQ